MEISPALLEHWLRDRYFIAEIDIGSSGVQDFSLAELRGILGMTQDELDRVSFRDSHSAGDPKLRKAIAERWGNGDPERVMATTGSSEAIFLIMHALLRADDEVVILTPCYHSLINIVESIGCRLKRWQLRREQQFIPDIEEARRLIGPRTRMVIVNIPHNPTGASLTPEQQVELVEIASHMGAYLVWDAAFAELTYDRPPLRDVSTLYDRSISIGTLSKGYGLAGLRVGWCLAAPDVVARCINVRDYVTLYLSPLIEVIAERVVTHGDRLLSPRLQQAQANLNILTDWALRHHEYIEWFSPQGGVTIFPRLRFIPDAEAFCRRLINTCGVLLVPGSCFDHPDHIRVGFGGSTEGLTEGLSRLSNFLTTY